MHTREELLQRARDLMLDAGESGYPLLESALQIIIRGSRFSLEVKTLLVAIGQLVVTLVETITGGRPRRGDVGDRRKEPPPERSWLEK